MKPILGQFLEETRIKMALPHIRGDVLDLGCGQGKLLEFLSPHQGYLGVDVDENMVRYLRQTFPDRTFIQQDLERQELCITQKFDTVVMLAILEHLADPQALFARMATWLKPGGAVVLTTPTPLGHRIHWIGARIGLFYREAADEHKAMYDQKSLLSLFQRHKFQMSHYKTFLFGANQLCTATFMG